MDPLRSIHSEDELLARRDQESYPCDGCGARGIEWCDRHWVCRRCATILIVLLRLEQAQASHIGKTMIYE